MKRKDPHGVQAKLDRVRVLHGRRVIAISANEQGVTLRFEGGYQFGPISYPTTLKIRNLLETEL